MIRSTHLVPLVIVAAAMLSPAGAGQIEERGIAPSTVVMEFPAALGVMERPAVEFDHAAHTTALEQEGCEACHTITDKGLSPRLTATAETLDRDDLINATHDACMGCHERRAASSQKGGPVTCGSCHVRRPPGVSRRVAMAFDYSLHARHAAAYPEKCDACHHIYDTAGQRLVYEKGTEEACRSCHGAEDVQRTLSLANASHTDCVGCHLQRVRAQQAGGPVLCVGCHDAEQRLTIKKLDEVPRLVRGQPDTLWITALETTSKVVPFNHKEHEPLTSSCSTCHHKTLKACTDCHTLTGVVEGARVTMAQSYHLLSSEHSCVGCHAVAASQRSCAGCHRQLGRPPGERACTVCHSGPQTAAQPLEIPPPVPVEVRLAPLPSPSDEFPEVVVISGMAKLYEPSNLPHLKIVTRLDAAVRESSLAGRFHATTATLCTGCHHHSPVGTRPPPCRACHQETADATTDRPGLKAAYHRQCLGCHQAMGIPKQGCADCHAEREG